MMNYQELAARTWIKSPDFDITDDQVMILWAAFGLAGEAGEVVDSLKKSIFHQHGIDTDHLAEEIGDVLWYVAALCTVLDLDMIEVMNQNIDKLKKRYPDGYDPDYSKMRMDKDVLL